MFLSANNNNNNNDNVYGAVIVAQSHCESSPGSCDECARRQAATDPQTRPNDLGCKSACRQPEATPTIAIYYYHSAQKLIVILPNHGW